MKIRVLPYDASWGESYAREKAALEQVFGSVAAGIHHIGSTAVVGLDAKPVIDILIEAESLAALDARVCAVEELGYEAMGEFGIPGRRFFRKGGDERTHHIHAFRRGDGNVARHLAFRDYLRAHPAVREE